MVFRGGNRVPPVPVTSYVVRPNARSGDGRTPFAPTGFPTLLFMRPSLPTALFATLLALGVATPRVSAQIMDRTMVPRGQLRLQAHPVFSSWDRRFGRTADGAEGIEELGDDLTASDATDLFPRMSALTDAVRQLGGLPGYDPVLGPTAGRVQQEATSIFFGADVGVFDWLTVSVVVPWNQRRTAVDLIHTPDTIAGDLGLSPIVGDAASVDAFLSSAAAAANVAAADANAICAGGAGPACTTAQDLADRTAAFAAGLGAAYAASPFFPLTGTAAGDGLSQALTDLNLELQNANLSTFLPLLLATERVTEDGFPLLTGTAGTGFAALPLQTRQGLWAVGDVEISARARLLDNLTPTADTPTSGFGYRVLGSFTVRLPTGTPEDPDILLDLGTGDGQLDVEGGVSADLRFGTRIGIATGGWYVRQGATTLTKRVVSPETVMAPADTRASLRWSPGVMLGVDVAPYLRLSSTLTLHGEYRYLHRFRDAFELTLADPALDPVVLELESGMKLHEVGGGVRYDTVEPWLSDGVHRPMEVHLRFLHAVSGSGGHAPKRTRVEAGLRLFRRVWGPTR